MENRGKGRARGRSRPADQGAVRPGSEGGGPSTTVPQKRPGGAWGSGPPRNVVQQGSGGIPAQQQPLVQPRGAWGAGAQQAQQARAPAPQQVPAAQHGRASFRGAGDSPGIVTHKGVSAGAGIGAATGAAGDIGGHSGRGAHRGRRALPENLVVTKPEHIKNKKGTSGPQVKLSSNYFQLLQKPDWCLFQYRVDFAPEEDHTGNKRSMLRTAVNAMDLSGYIFDGTVMYTPRRLEPNPLELFVDHPIVEGGDKVRITIRLVGDVNSGDYHYIQIFNIIMRKCMGFLKLQLVGRNFFDPGAKIVVPNYNLELWPGYVTSIRQHEHNILMCCEITHKVMRNETVYDLLMECSNESRGDYRALFQERITGSVVLTDYNNKTYRIDDVDFDTTPASPFKRKDGSSITYAEYYRERYGLNISRKDQPMLLSISKPREIRAGMSEKIFLVPELCRLTGLSDSQRANMSLMKAVANFTRVGPSQRIEKLHGFSRRLTSHTDIMKELRQWDLKLAENIVQFSGRVLPMEKLFGNMNAGADNSYHAGADVDWSRSVRAKKQFEDVALQNWNCIFPSRCKQGAYKFVQMLRKAADGLRWVVKDPKPNEIADDRVNSYLQCLDTISSSNPEMIMCVVTNQKSDRYNAIKKKCCVDRAIPTQIIQARNLDGKSAMSVATKVALQISCKVGGSPWTVTMPLKNIMVVGYDVCHDPMDKNKSYGAMVASMNTQITRYYSTVSAHNNGEELSNDFALNMIKAVKQFQGINKILPDKILIYRDGVGDGQLQYVYEHEVEIIRKALADYYGEVPVKMAFIVVSKRINTRIFKGGDNPTPGTVVDDVITLPERYDFFIVSQCTRQGTVSPTSYNILYDTFGLPADRLQILTYKFTHMYYNWAGTVRVPAPCQYAHKLAFLVAQSLRRTPNSGLENLLYYL